MTALLRWLQTAEIDTAFIDPGKPNQNAYIESFNGRFRDECLNEHWFTTLAHARPDRPAAGHGTQYSHHRTLNRSATEDGGDVAPILFRDVATEQAGLMERS